MSERYEGSCFCGAVKFNVSGKPAAMGYCHCASCRTWSASPINAFTMWKQDRVQVTQGADKIATYNKTDRSFRKWCTACGGHVFSDHPQWGLIDVSAAMLPDLRFQPTLHVHYQETRLPMKDGLPKMRDFPAEMGGSGETLPE